MYGDTNGTNLLHDCLSILEILPSKKDFPKDIVTRFARTKNGILFSILAALQTINAILDLKYSFFDPLTPTRCCHGAAALAYSEIQSISTDELTRLRMEGWNRYFALHRETNINLTTEVDYTWRVPRALIELTRLYLLSITKKVDPYRCSSFHPQKLKTEFAIGDRLSRKIIRRIQKTVANDVADEYASILKFSPKTQSVSGFPLSMWGEFTLAPYIRADDENKKFVAALYSNQLILGHIIAKKIPVALVNDVRDKDGIMINREFQLYLNHGKGYLEKISADEIKIFHPRQPIIVYGGCAYLKEEKNALYNKNTRKWLDNFPDLILASDCGYPQFPHSLNQSCSYDEPIAPSNEFLIEKLLRYLKLPGFNASDPSIFCLSHIYIASMMQIRQEFFEGKDGTLPYSFISQIARETTLEYMARFRSVLLEAREALKTPNRKIA